MPQSNSHDQTEIVGYYTLEEQRPNYALVNALLTEQGHPPLDEVSLDGGGGGALLLRDNWIVDTGGGGGGIVQEKHSYRTAIGGGYGHVSVGYLIMQTSWFRFYPLIGIGGFGQGLESKPDGENVDIIESASGGMLLNMGFGFDLTLRLSPFVFVCGLRVGFHIPTITEKESLGTPDASTPYFRFIIGGGMKNQKSHWINEKNRKK